LHARRHDLRDHLHLLWRGERRLPGNVWRMIAHSLAEFGWLALSGVVLGAAFAAGGSLWHGLLGLLDS
jgi:hypothetical protein